jgi:hypothetical protein
MRSFLTLLLILFCKLSIAQGQNNEQLNISEVYKYKSFNGFKYNYALEDELFLAKKYFKVSEIDKINEEFYKEIDFDEFSKIEGVFKFSDTLFFSDNINFEDGNFIVSEILSNTYNSIFNTNEYGFYVVNVRNEFSYFSDVIFSLKINVTKNSIILSSENELNLILNQGGYFYSDLRLSPYNNKLLAYQTTKRLFSEKKSNPKFNKSLAFQHLIMYSSLIESRSRIKEYFSSMISEVSRIKMVLQTK